MGYIGAGVTRFNTADELTVTGDAEFNGNATFGDNDKAIFGAGSDLQVFHSGTHSWINENGTGNLYIQSSGAAVNITNGSSRNLAQFNTTAGTATLYYDNGTSSSAKLATTSGGITVSGEISQADTSAGAYVVNRFENSSATGYVSNQMRVGSSGANGVAAFNYAPSIFLGIGMTSNDTTTPIVFWTNNATKRQEIASNGDISFYDSTGVTQGLYWDASTQRLGLGTSSPSQALTVNGNATVTGTTGIQISTLGRSSDNGILQLNNSGGVARVYLNSNGDSYFNGGNVGIGTSSPSSLLQVGDDSTSNNLITVASANNSFAGIDMMGDLGAAKGFRIKYEGNGNYFAVEDNTSSVLTERMRIDSSGRVHINQTSDWASSMLSAYATGAPALSARTNQTNGTCLITRHDGAGTAYNIQFYNGTNFVGSVQTTSSATSYVTSSDYRLKENITNAADAGDKIDAIQVRQFDWIVDGTHQDYGMVAQELMTVAPEAVSGNPESDEMMGVDYSKLVPMLIKEIQQLRSRVAALEAN